MVRQFYCLFNVLMKSDNKIELECREDLLAPSGEKSRSFFYLFFVRTIMDDNFGNYKIGAKISAKIRSYKSRESRSGTADP